MKLALTTKIWSTIWWQATNLCLKNSESDHVLAGKLILSVIVVPMLVFSQRWVLMLLCTEGLTIKIRRNAWLKKLWSLFGDQCFLLLVKVHKFWLIVCIMVIAPLMDLISTLCQMMIRLLTMRGLIHTMPLKNQLNFLLIFLNKNLTTNQQLIYSGCLVMTSDSRTHTSTLIRVTEWSSTLTPTMEKTQILN